MDCIGQAAARETGFVRNPKSYLQFLFVDRCSYQQLYMNVVVVDDDVDDDVDDG